MNRPFLHEIMARHGVQAADFRKGEAGEQH